MNVSKADRAKFNRAKERPVSRRLLMLTAVPLCAHSLSGDGAVFQRFP
jgi:hypothetical protein